MVKIAWGIPDDNGLRLVLETHPNMFKMLISCHDFLKVEFLHDHHGSKIGEGYLGLILVFQPQLLCSFESVRSDPLNLQVPFFDSFIYRCKRSFSRLEG